MATVTSGNLSKIVKSYYDRRFLERLTPNLRFKKDAVPKELPKHEGNVVVWHRFWRWVNHLLLLGTPKLARAW